MILTSRADLPLPEVVRRHRGKQGQENAQKGPLTELGLHHPPCKSYVANQAFYQCGQIAQLLLELVQSQSLPMKAKKHGLRPLIRDSCRWRAADMQRAAVADAFGAGQPAITLADARGGQARTGLTARAAVRSRLVQLSGERPEGRGASAGVRPGERTGRVGGSGGRFLGPLGFPTARKPPQ